MVRAAEVTALRLTPRLRADGARARRGAGAGLAVMVHVGVLAWWWAAPGLRIDVPQVLDVKLVAEAVAPVVADPAVSEISEAVAQSVVAAETVAVPAPVVVMARPGARSVPVPVARAAPRPVVVAPVGEVPAAAPVVSQVALVAAYQAVLSAHLERYRRYPPGARQRREQGVATVRFTVDRGGRVVALAMAGASGFAALDDEALATLRRAEPLPGIPAEVTAGELEFVLPLRFQVQ